MSLFKRLPLLIPSLALLAAAGYLVLKGADDGESLASVEVQWTETDSPAYRGFEDPGSLIASYDVAPEPWQLFVATEDGDPRLVAETDRWLQSVEWSQDDSRIINEYYTAGVPLDPSGYNVYRGISSQELTGGAKRADFTIMGWLFTSPSGDRLLVNDRHGGTQERYVTYLVDLTSGKTLRLDGLGDAVQAVGWSPDESSVLFYRDAATVPGDSTLPSRLQAREYFIATPGDTRAVHILDTDSSGHPQWSSDGKTLAYVDERGLSEDGFRLVLVDVSTGRRREVDLGGRFGYRLEWHGGLITVADGVVDAATATLLVKPAGAALDSVPSPDGRSVALSQLAPELDHQACVGPPVQAASHAVLIDVATGGSRVLYDCTVANHEPEAWVSERALLLSQVACCHGQTSGYALYSFSSGAVQELTEGMEPGSRWAVSPGGDRLLVSGNRLRLYDVDGHLLREISPPAGRQVVDVAWSHDGKHFAYTVGRYSYGPL